MRILWVIGAALAGRKVMGLPGAVLAGTLGYFFGTLSPAAKTARPVAAPLSEETGRYPEEAIIDAMQESEREVAVEGEEMANLFSAVSGRKNSPIDANARETGPD